MYQEFKIKNPLIQYPKFQIRNPKFQIFFLSFFQLLLKNTSILILSVSISFVSVGFAVVSVGFAVVSVVFAAELDTIYKPLQALTDNQIENSRLLREKEHKAQDLLDQFGPLIQN